MLHHTAAVPLLARGFRQHIDILRHGTQDERALSRAGLRLWLDFVARLAVADMGRVLDRVLAPGFREVDVRAPVFVVAPPRSGTTLLYALLAADPRFLAPRLYETIVPSVSLLRLAEWLRAQVEVHGDGHGLSRWEAARFAAFEALHRVRLDDIEEDTLLFDRHLTCPSSLRFFPRASELLPLVVLDERPPSVRAAVMAAYHGSVQRLLYRAPGHTWLAKNVYSAGRIGSLLERYPDARFINIVRSPYEVIPSAIRLFRASNYAFGLAAGKRPTLPLDHPVWRPFVDLVIDGYQRLLQWERRVPASQWITLRFPALVDDPLGAVRGIYERFGIALPPAVEAAIASAAHDAPAFRSAAGPTPTLEDVGLDREEVHARLREVFEAYALPRSAARGRATVTPASAREGDEGRGATVG